VKQAAAEQTKVHWNEANRGQRKDEARVDLRTVPKALRRDPCTGQSGPEMDLGWANLNDTEKALVRDLDNPGHGRRMAKHVSALAEGNGLTKLQVRNGMRRLVRACWVEASEPPTEGTHKRGWYRVSEPGRKRLARVAGSGLHRAQ